MSVKEAPAVEAIKGNFVFAIRSKRGQSVNDALAIFKMSKFCFSIRETEGSSNGVHMEVKPEEVIAFFSVKKSSSDKRVSEKRLMYLMSVRSL
jgi:hypothetical protein